MIVMGLGAGVASVCNHAWVGAPMWVHVVERGCDVDLWSGSFWRVCVEQQSVCSWRALSFLCVGGRMVFLGERRFVPTCVGCFTLSCALLLTDCPPSSSHARLRLHLSWPWPCPSASLFLPARVLRVHPSRDAPRGEAVPGPAQEPVPYQGAEGHRPPPGKGFELDGWRGWHDGMGSQKVVFVFLGGRMHAAGLRKFIFEVSVFRCCSGLLFQSNQYIQQGARRLQ